MATSASSSPASSWPLRHASNASTISPWSRQNSSGTLVVLNPLATFFSQASFCPVNRYVRRTGEAVDIRPLAAGTLCIELVDRERDFLTAGRVSRAQRARIVLLAGDDDVAIVPGTLEPPPERLGVTHWSSRLLAAELGISNVKVANVWREWGCSRGGPRASSSPLTRSWKPRPAAIITDMAAVLAYVGAALATVWAWRTPYPPARASAAIVFLPQPVP
jgi:hypothetical protein